MNKTQTWTEEDLKRNEQSTSLTAELHGLSCPQCQSRKFTKNGKLKGNQRYLCSKCGKHFRNTTGNTIHHLHLKPKIEAYIKCMNEGLSLRKTAEKINISLQTAFRWRHRFLNAIKNKPAQNLYNQQTVSTYTLPYSSKGKKTDKKKQPNITSIIQTDATGKTSINVIGKYGQNTNRILQLSQGKTLHLTSRAMPKAFRQGNDKQLTATQKNRSNKIHAHISNWLCKFRGVASKYLQNYWAWFILIRQTQIRNSITSQYMHSTF